MATNNYSKITPEIQRLAGICQSNAIDPELYTTYDVKRGLRDINGKGVLTGLTVKEFLQDLPGYLKSTPRKPLTARSFLHPANCSIAEST